MYNFNKRFSAFLYGVLIGFTVISPATAEDIEIYLGSGSSQADWPSNIMFVIDTSGSMEYKVTEAKSSKGTFDPNTNYTGTYVTDRIYYTTGSNAYTTANYVVKAYFVCDAGLGALNSVGYYAPPTKAAQLNNAGNSWGNIASTTRYVDCQDDYGKHGKAASDGSPYTINSSAKWTSTVTNIWDTAGQTYKFKTGGYLNWENLAAGTINVTTSRMQYIKAGMHSILDGIGASSAKIGLMRFSSNDEGGMVLAPLESVSTAKTNLLTQVDALVPVGPTPLGETMFEAASYYRGGAVDYGVNSKVCGPAANYLITYNYNTSNMTSPSPATPPYSATNNDAGQCNTQVAQPSVAASWTGSVISQANYISPITLQCQKNFIIYLTDGDPTSDVGVSQTKMGNIGVTGPERDCSAVGTSAGYQSNCLDDIAKHLATSDQVAESILTGAQVVSTYTIGFGTGLSASGEALLRNTAAVSKTASDYGEYFTATTTDDLVDAITSIFQQIGDSNNTFSSPAISVNAFNKTYHDDALYFSLFKPSLGAHWDGNFKRYKLDFDTNNNPVIRDRDEVAAVDATTGYFTKTARSYWSDVADGDSVISGGAAYKLTGTRNIYTYTGTVASLNSPVNAVHENTFNVSVPGDLARFGLPTGTTEAAFDNLLKWARGLDVDDVDEDGSTTDGRLVMGDPLHGEPALITYGGTETDPDVTVYVPTNDGYLHAFTVAGNTGAASTVTETFAFIPPELLSNLNTLYQDSGSTPKVYGLDGSVSAWVYDKDKDGIIEPADDHVYLYFGMRRGGKQYYALDVTKRNDPKMMWSITGGTGDFAELSQTWSQPTLAKLRIAGADKHVLVFAGGYDTNQDGVAVRTPDTTGRAVYIVDAATGQRLWWASSLAGADLKLNEMGYSMPSTVSVIDADGDTYADKLFVGDMGGQIFRFDIARSESGSLSSQIKGGRIADFAQDNSAADVRRFYYPPSVALQKGSGNVFKLVMSIASGYREHPLVVNNKDRIYVMETSPVKNAPASYTTLTEADLFDTTANLIQVGTDAQKTAAKASLDAASGWYITMETVGEKGLSKTLIAAGTVFVSTYVPKDATNTSQACFPNEGGGKTYVMDMNDGSAKFVDTANVPDRNFWVLEKDGIPADVRTIFTNNKNQDDMAVCVGTECIQADNTSKHQKLYWLGR